MSAPLQPPKTKPANLLSQFRLIVSANLSSSFDIRITSKITPRKIIVKLIISRYFGSNQPFSSIQSDSHPEKFTAKNRPTSMAAIPAASFISPHIKPLMAKNAITMIIIMSAALISEIFCQDKENLLARVVENWFFLNNGLLITDKIVRMQIVAPYNFQPLAWR